jgi:hypothetical protein
MENPYPRRHELPTNDRIVIAEIDKQKHAIIRDLDTLSEQAAEVFNANQLYPESTYLGDYIQELTPFENTPALGSSITQNVLEATNAFVATQAKRDKVIGSLPDKVQGLFAPVRDLEDARKIKEGNMAGSAHYDPSQPEIGDYREVRIEASDEPLVSLLDYGINCRSYYSRPNGVTGDPVPGVKPDVFVRASIAEKLVMLNNILKEPEIVAFFGDEVEIFVDEGYRDPEIQAYLYNEYLPKMIINQLAHHNGIDLESATEDELDALTKEMIPIRNKKSARPSKFHEGTPGPHQTGAAVDMTIRYKQDTTDLVPRVNIWFGKEPANLVKVNDPDHFEHTLPVTHEELVAQQNLRAWHYLLGLVGLKQNPTELWHTGAGDQLSAILDGDVDSVKARYGWPAENPKTYIAPDESEIKE